LLDKFDLAERQFRMAVEANPKAGNPRLLLVQTLVRAKQPEKAAVEVGEAQMAIEGDLAKVAIGQCYEIIGNTELAREHYEEALKQAPNNPDMRRTWVEFLMKTTAFAQAETELKQVLLQKFGSSKPEQEYRRWAQQRLVDALRSQQKTEKLDEAIIVLNDQIKQSGRESLDDKRRMAQILALYPSREKRQLAIEILEKLVEKEKVVALEAEERWMLAGLYQKAGESEKSRTELRNLIATRKDDIRALVGYIQLSLIANEPAEADLYLSSLKKLAPKDPTTLDLEIQILSARKNYAGITNLLKTIEAIPYENQDPETALRRQTWIARSFASTANKLAQSNDIRASKEFNAEADRFFSKLNMEKPDFTLMYAEYLSVTPEIDRALDLVQEHLTDISFARLERVTRNVMKNRLANPEQLARLQDFLQTREGKTEENIPLSLLTSDLLSWRGDLKASSERFKELLQRNENNVIVLNNYAVILALSSTENKEALRLINQAIKIGGPIDAFYDTRGMIYLAGLRPDLAVQDFERAATESDSAERRFHAAVAYSRMAASGGAGEERSLQAAKKSLARADELGLIEHDLHPLERVTLAKLRKDLDMPEPSK
jgi:tetratricopeptide (TPR) repeat protein